MQRSEFQYHFHSDKSASLVQDAVAARERAIASDDDFTLNALGDVESDVIPDSPILFDDSEWAREASQQLYRTIFIKCT